MLHIQRDVCRDLALGVVGQQALLRESTKNGDVRSRTPARCHLPRRQSVYRQCPGQHHTHSTYNIPDSTMTRTCDNTADPVRLLSASRRGRPGTLQTPSPPVYTYVNNPDNNHTLTIRILYSMKSNIILREIHLMLSMFGCNF